MKLSRFQSCQLFEIRKPYWNGRKVGLATYKIGPLNEVRILYKDANGDPVYPQPFFISGENARKYPIEPVRSNPNIKLHIIPINDLEILERI